MEVLDAHFVGGGRRLDELPAPAFAEIAFAGRSNVGKSSLINAMTGRRKLVRTSGEPGCTRGIDIYRVRLRRGQLDFVDLPGYGYARRSKAERMAWGPLVEGFLRTRPGLRGVVVIADVRRGIEQDDEQLIEFVEQVERTPIVVATKLDKLAPSKRKPRLAELGRQAGHAVHGFSATERVGVEALWEELLRAAALAPAPDQESR